MKLTERFHLAIRLNWSSQLIERKKKKKNVSIGQKPIAPKMCVEYNNIYANTEKEIHWNNGIIIIG